MLYLRYHGKFVTELPACPDYGISPVVTIPPKPVLLYGFYREHS